MKKYLKEIIICLLQILLFYVFPLFGGPTDVMGVVILQFLLTIVLSFLMGILSSTRLSSCYSAFVALIFAPTIPIFYNYTAMIYIVWYLIVSGVGLLFGMVIRKIFFKFSTSKYIENNQKR